MDFGFIDPAAQFNGRNFNINNWNNRVINNGAWPEPPIVSSPETIIGEFENQHYLQALALVVSWGTMWRQNPHIYGNRNLQSISNALIECATSIQATNAINDSWLILTGDGIGQLGWSPVITSKTLHFLCRALGHENDPPVAIDNAVILQRVWPCWRSRWVHLIDAGQRPQGWRGSGLETYLRYMTAIKVWADLRGWTTTQLEASIFASFRNGQE